MHSRRRATARLRLASHRYSSEPVREGLTLERRLMEEAEIPADAEDDDLIREVSSSEKPRPILSHPTTLPTASLEPA